MDWKQQKVLVTGAGGFIGSHLTERLTQRGAQTRAFVHYNSLGSWGWLETSQVKGNMEVILGDVRDHESVRHAMRGIDIVYHLAALIAIPHSYRAPLSYVRTNIEGTLNVLQAARDEKVSLIVQTSTSEVYGTARTIPIDETHPLQGQSPYAATKIAADKLAESFYRSFNLPVTTIRPFNTFGPRQSARAIIPTIIIQALTQSTIKLGNQRPTRDFNFVDDTVEGFLKIAECPKAVGEVVNIGSGKEASVADLAKLLVTHIGRDIPITFDVQRVRPENSEVDRLCADNRKAETLINWRPAVSLKEGLGKTIDWLEKNLERYKAHVYNM